MLLKNAMDFGEIASELPEPNPLDVALARARNQGPAPGANLKRLPPRSGTGSIQEMDMMMQQGRGETPLGQPIPPPQERMITDFNLQQNMKAGGMPSTHALSGPQ